VRVLKFGRRFLLIRRWKYGQSKENMKAFEVKAEQGPSTVWKV